MSSISIKQLLEAGVHFGHQTSRWNPKMKDFIFGERNGIHIIDLQKTLRLFKEAVDFLTDLGSNGKQVLFVGTKRQAQEAIAEDAARCGMHYVTNRWLGGLLTNFETVQKSIKRFKQLESMRDEGFYEKLSKKEVAKLERERKKLEKNLSGIRNMDSLPDAMIVIDSDKEAIAVKEANKLGIPVIAVVDTNCDPDQIDFLIPGNDDALRSVRLFTSTIAEAVMAGRSVWDAKVEEERKAREEAEKKEAIARAAREKARAERAARAAKAKEEAEAAAKAAAAAAAEKAKEAKAAAKAEEAAALAAKPAEPVKAEAEIKPEPETAPTEAEEAAAGSEKETAEKTAKTEPSDETAEDSSAAVPAAETQESQKPVPRKSTRKKVAKKAKSADQEDKPAEVKAEVKEAKPTEKEVKSKKAVEEKLEDKSDQKEETAETEEAE